MRELGIQIFHHSFFGRVHVAIRKIERYLIQSVCDFHPTYLFWVITKVAWNGFAQISHDAEHSSRASRQYEGAIKTLKIFFDLIFTGTKFDKTFYECGCEHGFHVDDMVFDGRVPESRVISDVVCEEQDFLPRNAEFIYMPRPESGLNHSRGIH